MKAATPTIQNDVRATTYPAAKRAAARLRILVDRVRASAIGVTSQGLGYDQGTSASDLGRGG
jgi:hypothetical protein